MITLETLKDATPQEVLDQAVNHLLTQNVKCVDSGNYSCMYRLGQLKCVAGCFIGDDEYEPEMELIPWKDLIIAGIVPAYHDELIMSLQTIHDNSSPMMWRQKLQELAVDFKLKFNPPA